MEKTVPRAGPLRLLHTRTWPLCRSTSCATTHRPRPVPVSGLVEKNGSKMWRIVSRSMPEPESQKVTRMPSTVRFRQSREGRSRIRSLPFRDIASIEFATRLAKICCASVGMHAMATSPDVSTSTVISEAYNRARYI